MNLEKWQSLQPNFNTTSINASDRKQEIRATIPLKIRIFWRYAFTNKYSTLAFSLAISFGYIYSISHSDSLAAEKGSSPVFCKEGCSQVHRSAFIFPLRERITAQMTFLTTHRYWPNTTNNMTLKRTVGWFEPLLLKPENDRLLIQRNVRNGRLQGNWESTCLCEYTHHFKRTDCDLRESWEYDSPPPPPPPAPH